MEQASAKKTETAPESVDPPLSRFGVRQAFDLIDLLSSFGVARAFASPAARSRQSLTPWASMGGGSVTLVEALDLAASGSDAHGDVEARLGRVRAFAAQCLREHAAPTVLSVAGRPLASEPHPVGVDGRGLGDPRRFPRPGRLRLGCAGRR